MRRALILASVICGLSRAQLSLPVSPVIGNPQDLEITVNPRPSALFSALIQIGMCRFHLRGSSVVLYQGSSNLVSSSGEIAEDAILSSPSCKIDLGKSKLFALSYRIRIQHTGANLSGPVPVIAEYSWIKTPYLFQSQTLGDWNLPAEPANSSAGAAKSEDANGRAKESEK
jgi:hypothetical protein